MTRQQVGWYDGSRVHQLEVRKPGAPVPRHLAHTANWVAVFVEDAPARADVLDMAYINSLPQPFMGKQLGGWWWPIHDFEVASGMLRMDVSGLLQVSSVGDFTRFRDGNGDERSSEAFYSDALPEDRVILPKEAAPLPPSLQAQAQAVGAACDPESIEPSEPV